MGTWRRKAREQDLDRELRADLELEAAAQQEKGLSDVEARYAARRRLGNLTLIREDARAVWVARWLDEFLQDLRYAFRMLRKNAAFTVVAALTLAVGIGANTAMFSVAYGMLLRPLAYPEADRVAVIYMRYFPRDFKFGTMCMRDYLIWRHNNRAFEDPSLFTTVRMDIGGKEGAPEQVRGASVNAGFFPTLRVQPLIGRTFARGEDGPGSRSLAVLSESMWRRRFAGSSAVLGESVVVNGSASTVIGVMPAAFGFPRRDIEVWTNLTLNAPTRYGPWLYHGLGRLKPGITLEQAQAETNNIGLRMMQQNPNYKRLSLPLLGLRESLLGTTLKPAILALAAAVGCVLLIAVVNLVNLTLARATVREREMAVRLSLGARRARLMRQLLTESVLLAIIGGAGGVALAWAGIELIRAWNPGNFPSIDSVRLDERALGFMFVVSVLTGIVFGLAPALESVRTDLNSTLKQGGRTGSDSRTRGRARGALVVIEIAASLMLLVGAALLLRTLFNLQRVNGGFFAPPRQILTMLVSADRRNYSDARKGLPFFTELLRRARNVPGVERVALTDSLPPERQGDADTFQIEGQALAPGEQNPVISDVTVSPDLFQTLGIPLIKGRYFNDHDDLNSKPVVIVSQAFASRFFPNQEPIGKRIMQSGPGSENDWRQIVGVVGNVKYLGLAVDTDPAYYMPFAQSYGPQMFLVVRSSVDAAGLTAMLRREIQSLDPGMSLARIASMQQSMETSVSQPRFNALLLALFAGIALILAAVGIYGLIAYLVAQRTHEIGVRMALGAARTQVLRLVIARGTSLGVLGIVIGLGGAFAVTGWLHTLTFGVDARDGVTFGAAPLTIMLVVLVATFIPALRATRISPVVALRHE